MADLPIKELGDEAPVYDRPVRRHAEAAGDRRRRRSTPPMADRRRAGEADRRRPTCARKRWVWEQYDHVILGNTVQRPGGDAAVVRVEDGPKGARAHHRRDAALLRGRSVRGRQAGGGGSLAQPHRGRRQAARASPTISISAIRSGRRSWASSSAASAASPRPARRSTSRSCPAMSRSTTRPTAGRSCRRRPSAASACSTTSPSRRRSPSRREGEAILLIGETNGWLGQSLYLREICGREEGAPPPVDLAAEKRNGDFVRALIRDGSVDRGARCLRRRPAGRARRNGDGVRHRRDARPAPADACRRMPSGSARIRRATSSRSPDVDGRRMLARGRRRPACRCAGIGHDRRRCVDCFRASGPYLVATSEASASKAGCRPTWPASASLRS